MIIQVSFDSLTPGERILLNGRMARVRIPGDVSRQPSSLSKLKRWNASDFKVFLFYLAPVLLQDLLSSERFKVLCAFSVAVHILCMKQISEDGLKLASDLLNYFNNQFVTTFQYKRQSYNVHSIRHLVWQVRRYGPLSSCSAFAFESANHFLKAPLTGTVNQCEIMVKRFINRRYLLKSAIESDELAALTKKNLNIVTPPLLSTFSKPSVTTLAYIVDRYGDAGDYEVCSRYRSGGIVYSSAAYSREQRRVNSVVQIKRNNMTDYCKVHVSSI